MTYSDKLTALERYQRRKPKIIALRNDLDFWEAFSGSSAGNNENPGASSQHSNSSPTENAAQKALEVRAKIEVEIGRILVERENLISRIESVPEKYRGILYLVYVSGYSVENAAKCLDMTADAAYKLRKRAIEKLDI